ncbi:hypothetical protein ACHAWF_009443 [Thalassiosira exigua]
MIVSSGDPGSKGRHLPGGGGEGGGNRTTSPGKARDGKMLDGSVGGRSGHRRISSAPRFNSSSLDVSEPKVIRSAVDVDAGDYDQRTALHLAAGEGHLDVVQFLCKRGANANAADEGHRQPPNHRSSHNFAASRAGSLVDPVEEASPDEDKNLRVDFSELEMIERIGSRASGCSLLDIFKANSLSKSRIPKRAQVVYAQQLAQGMNHLPSPVRRRLQRNVEDRRLLPGEDPSQPRAYGGADLPHDGRDGIVPVHGPEVFRHEEYTEVDVYSYAMIFYSCSLGRCCGGGCRGWTP